MNKILSIDDVSLKNKCILIRVDFNVPIQSGKIINDARIIAALPTIKKTIDAKAKILIVSHLGRPTPGEVNEEYSLQPIATHLASLLSKPVRLAKDWINGVNLNPQEIVLCENVRFLIGETENDLELAKKMAALCDVFIMDAFGSAHRAHASTEGIARFAPCAVAGPLLLQEIKALDHVINSPAKPIVAIVGGSKVSTKLLILQQLINNVDILIVGGGIANAFIAAQEYNIGSSLCEKNLIPAARKILQDAKRKYCRIVLPKDVVVADRIDDNAKTQTKLLSYIGNNEKILDIGPKTIETYTMEINNAKTILWNGPVGIFEYKPFAKGTESIAKAIAKSKAFSVAGGGDTIAAIEQFGVSKNLSYISTGGGAFLEYLEGKSLPGIEVLTNRCK